MYTKALKQGVTRDCWMDISLCQVPIRDCELSIPSSFPPRPSAARSYLAPAPAAAATAGVATAGASRGSGFSGAVGVVP